VLDLQVNNNIVQWRLQRFVYKPCFSGKIVYYFQSVSVSFRQFQRSKLQLLFREVRSHEKQIPSHVWWLGFQSQLHAYQWNKCNSRHIFITNLSNPNYYTTMEL